LVSNLLKRLSDDQIKDAFPFGELLAEEVDLLAARLENARTRWRIRRDAVAKDNNKKSQNKRRLSEITTKI
jgi:hypothetical protein